MKLEVIYVTESSILTSKVLLPISLLEVGLKVKEDPLKVTNEGSVVWPLSKAVTVIVWQEFGSLIGGRF